MKEYDYSKKSTDWLMEVVTADKSASPRQVAAKRELDKRAHGKWRKRLVIKLSVMIIVGIVLLVCRYIYYR